MWPVRRFNFNNVFESAMSIFRLIYNGFEKSVSTKI